jgi:uncharacterized membrane protein YheB (UPF0754 family)
VDLNPGNLYVLLSLPLIAALIGWFTNFLAVKMLFHPRKKVDLYFFSIQGIFPKRQKVLAQKLGKIVARELFSFSDIRDRFTSTETAVEINSVLDEKLEDFIENKLKHSVPALIALFIGSEMRGRIKNKIHEEFQNILPDILTRYSDKLEKDIQVEEIVAEKVAAFSAGKLETILFSIMQKEFRFIELIGGILGFLIGLIQIGLLLFLV